MVNINDLVGVAYVNEGRSVTQGLDCWGLVREYYRRDGLTLPKFPINATHTDEVMDEIEKNQVNWENWKSLKSAAWCYCGLSAIPYRVTAGYIWATVNLFMP